MRIARPFLNTKLGKMGISACNTARYYAVEGVHKVVDGAEWVFDKGAQLVNYAGRKATDFANYAGRKATDVTSWIADTCMVKKGVGIAKDVGSWVASSRVFQSAIEMAISVYRKMSNFCTAMVESYQYYNQCRTMARRIVNESPSYVDEHTILRSCHDVMKQEAKKMDNNVTEDEVSFTIKYQEFFFLFNFLKFKDNSKADRSMASTTS